MFNEQLLWCVKWRGRDLADGVTSIHIDQAIHLTRAGIASQRNVIIEHCGLS
jgi:hypothetical protein